MYTFQLLKKNVDVMWDDCAVCSDMCARRGKNKTKENQQTTSNQMK